MDATKRERLQVVMALLAAGDVAAVFMLAHEFGDQIGAALHRHLADLGVIRVDRDDAAGLLLDACFALAVCAPAWRADGGALPWTWADRRLRGLASEYVGIHAGELHQDLPEPEPGSPPRAEADEVDLLHALAEQRAECALLVHALDSVATRRNQGILLAVKVQAALGDPSPAVTVAGLFGLRPDAVRQVVKRVLDRLRRLAAGDERYALLADLAILG